LVFELPDILKSSQVRTKGKAVDSIQNKTVAASDLVKVLLLTLLLLSPPFMAAENGAQAQTDNQDQASEELEDSAAPESEDTGIAAQVSNTELAVADEGDEVDKPEDEGGSRFIPTEQISQDLGVSFPVDI
jgi:hypothetical protein